MQKDKMLPVSVPRHRYPCREQTAEDVTAYYRRIGAGDLAVVRHTRGHVLKYVFDRISGTKIRSGRIDLEHHGAFYAKSGKSCWTSTGQSNLVVPTLQILEWGEGYIHATEAVARGLSLEDVEGLLSGRIERLPPAPPPHISTVEECRQKVEQAKRELDGLQRGLSHIVP